MVDILKKYVREPVNGELFRYKGGERIRKKKKKISVIVTTKSNPDNIYRLTQKLAELQGQFSEYVVVDAGTPKLEYILGSYPFANIVDGSGSNRAVGKNIGVMHSHGDVAVFLDDDTVPDYKFFYEVKKWIPYFDIIAGYSKNPTGRDMPRVSCFVDGNDISFPSCNLAVSVDLFEKIGMFDGSFITAEDMDFLYRAVKGGGSIFYNPKMMVFHYHRSTAKGFLKQAFWNGYGRKQLNRKHPDITHNHGVGVKNMVRLGSGFIGYMLGDFFNE